MAAPDLDSIPPHLWPITIAAARLWFAAKAVEAAKVPKGDVAFSGPAIELINVKEG